MIRAATLALTFALGACAGASVSTRASESPAGAPPVEVYPEPDDAVARAHTVIALADAERRSPPGSLASIAVLARGQGAFLGLLELPGGGAVPEHRDPTEEYIYVLEGGGTITVDGVAHEIGPGSAVYMPPEALVTYQNGAEPLVALQVFAGPEGADKYDSWEPR